MRQVVALPQVVYKGREVKPDQTVEAAGLGVGAVLTTVRKALVAEGWKVGEDISFCFRVNGNACKPAQTELRVRLACIKSCVSASSFVLK